MNNTARNFALQLGALISLYLSLSFLLVLLFGVINITLPDSTDRYWEIEDAASSIRIGFAMVIVFFPVYLTLTRAVNNVRRSDSQGAYLTLTKWLIYLSLLVGGAVLLGDLVAVIMAFLEGEITQRFLLKAGAVLLIIGAAFHYYLLDAKGYWVSQEKHSKWYGLVVATVVGLSLLVGLISIDNPGEVRKQKLDEQQIQDLTQIQYSLESYYYHNGEALPRTLAELREYEWQPSAPEDREPYTYEVTEEGFQLCATFAGPSHPDEDSPFYYAPITKDALFSNSNNWSHDAGRYCFERKLNRNSV